MDQPECMNLVRVDAEVRCTSEQAEAMVGHFDHVEYGADTGFARLHITTTSADSLLTEARRALDHVDDVLAKVGLSDKVGLSLSIGTEELIEDNGTWRRRGDLVAAAPTRTVVV